MYKITKELFIEIMAKYITLAKNWKGELVALNKVKDESDEIVISNIKDIDYLKIKNGNMIEVTIYVDDEDELFEEFIIVKECNTEEMKKKILARIPK